MLLYELHSFLECDAVQVWSVGVTFSRRCQGNLFITTRISNFMLVQQIVHIWTSQTKKFKLLLTSQTVISSNMHCHSCTLSVMLKKRIVSSLVPSISGKTHQQLQYTKQTISSVQNIKCTRTWLWSSGIWCWTAGSVEPNLLEKRITFILMDPLHRQNDGNHTSDNEVTSYRTEILNYTTVKTSKLL